jgi:hypothetical protein
MLIPVSLVKAKNRCSPVSPWRYFVILVFKKFQKCYVTQAIVTADTSLLMQTKQEEINNNK